MYNYFEREEWEILIKSNKVVACWWIQVVSKQLLYSMVVVFLNYF
jgi:hypothetical protein